MISDVPSSPLPVTGMRGLVRDRAPLLIGCAVMMIPTLIALGQQSWTLEIGAHGPIVLATGIWLLVHAQREPNVLNSGEHGALAITAPVVLLGLGLYVFGRAYDFLSLEAAGCYLVAVGLLHDAVGLVRLRLLAFPLAYLAFIIPPPGWLIDQLTAPLQHFVSSVSTSVLAAFGYPIARNGVVIFIAQYQLLVEQACAGMNSIVGLTAITVFYIYILHRSTWRYALLLMAFILPVAILTNICRVMALVLVTYYLGDAAAQGFLHGTTGIVLFSVALALMIGVDTLFQFVMGSRHKSSPA